jgi:glutamate synthase domain-containing protein 3
MLSRVFYDEKGRITGHEVLDKFGRPIKIPHGEFPSQELTPSTMAHGTEVESNPSNFFKERLPVWGFNQFGKALEGITKNLPVGKAIEELTRICDYLPGWETGSKDRGTLLHWVHEQINSLLDHVNGKNGMIRVTRENAGKLTQPENREQVLVVDARGFKPEGIDPLRVLSCFLDHAHRLGWRKFILYRVGGQRGIGMGMGSGSTTDTTVDVFGSPGEYCGAFNMGALVRVHNHAQNFTGMVMHSGTLEIHGDAGKVTGYSAKGGTFNILGNVVDRGWVCAVSDPRGPGLQVNIVGTAYEHLGQALMGGSVLMLGLFRGYDGMLRRMDSPYRGAKILAGASAGEAIFYDPSRRLEEAQYKGCSVHAIDDQKWKEIVNRLLSLETIFGLGLSKENGHLNIRIDGHLETLSPEQFRWIIPRGELEGYH